MWLQNKRQKEIISSKKLKKVSLNSLEDQLRNLPHNNQDIKNFYKYRTLSLGSYKMFFKIENNELVYKFL